MDAQEPAIVVRNLHKDFVLPQHKSTSVKQALVNITRKHGKTTQRVLDGINFTVNKGDFFAIVGRNGSGKSTLLKILAGVYSPTAGEVVLNGGLTPFIELGVGFNPELSGRDNVFLNGALLGFSRKEMAAMYDDIVEFAELAPFMDQKLKNYSSGMQVRLAFSVAIRAKSDILLLDEVLAVGDAAFQQKCYNYFEQLKRERKTVVFVSHDMGAVRRFCSRAIYVKDGQIVLEGSPADIADYYAESNIGVSDSDETKDTAPSLPEGYTVSARITKQTNKTLELSITYNARPDDPAYIGIAVVKDGVSIGEITTPPTEPLYGKGKVTYTLDKTIFNGGIYWISGTCLFRAQNRELVAVSKQKYSFAITGSDITRGAALRLAATWKYEKGRNAKD